MSLGYRHQYCRRCGMECGVYRETDQAPDPVTHRTCSETTDQKRARKRRAEFYYQWILTAAAGGVGNEA